MRLIIVRHGDPNYEIDSLTETGWKEAELLSERLSKMNIDDFYLSPLGRAQDTARATLKKMGKNAVTYDWLREFDPRINRPDKPGEKMIAWDWLPEDWTSIPEFYNVDTWTDHPSMKEGNVKEEYDWVCENFDKVLAKYGYVRNGKNYDVINESHKTIAFVCHFGLECVLISHLLNVSPMILWHGFCAAPTSVTTIYTEERRKGTASFRVNAFGDISHINMAGEKPSFAARFSECYSDEFGRLD